MISNSNPPSNKVAAESSNQNNDGSPPITNEAAVRLITSSIRSISNNTNGITNISMPPQQNNHIANDNESMDAAQEQITITGSSIQLNDVLFSPDCDTSLATFIFNNIGNRRFRVLVEANLFKYLSAGGSSGKQHEIVQGVIKSVMGNNPSGRFLIRATDNAESSWRSASVDETVKYVNSVFLAAERFASQLSQRQQQLPSPHPTGPKGDDEVPKPSECLDSSISNVSSKPCNIKNYQNYLQMIRPRCRRDILLRIMMLSSVKEV